MSLPVPGPRTREAQDPAWVRWLLTGLAVTILTVLVIIPVVHVFFQAFQEGWSGYARNLFADPDTRHAVFLTLTVAPCAVILNVLFGVAAAWCVTRFRFPGRTLLVTMIDLPFSISPVVVGLLFVLLFGASGYFGPFLIRNGLEVLYSFPGLVLATTFVTLPIVARELIPVMEAIGSDEEMAAMSLGAGGWQIFRKITLPNIRWGLLYGILLCNARAMGEFGAVYVVSGHIAGQTNTMPLHIEQLFQGFNSVGAFAVASVLTLLAGLTLVLKSWVEGKKAETVKRPGAEETA